MKRKLSLLVDIMLFAGWTVVGLLNLVFFIIHASPVNLAGLFDGGASISFTFMAASSVTMLSMSALIIYLAARRKELFWRLRGCIPWKAARVLLSAFAAFFITVVSMMVAASFPGVIPPTSEIIILGAHVAPEGLSSTLESRLIAAAEYAKSNPGARLILSGGQGLDEPVSEAAAMFDYLTAQGIDKERLLLEDKSHNTYENLTNSYALLPTGGEPYPVTIVTSEFHILRTSILAERAGFKAYFVPARTPRGILPSCYSREFFGLIKSYISDR